MRVDWITLRRRALRLLVICIVLVALFLISMTLVYSLPREPVMRNLRASLPLLESEGLYPAPVMPDSALMLDNFTDALMLNMAAGRPDMSSPRQALLALNAGEATDTIIGLRRTVSGELPSRPYSRYWHGYQVILRPALFFLPLDDIRYLNLLALGIVLLATLQLLFRRAGPRALWAFALSLMLTGFYVVPLSLQFSSVWYVTLASVVAVLLLAERPGLGHVDLELFFVVGMFTAFFDLLTAPLLTLGMPLIVLLVMRARARTQPTLRADALVVAKLSAVWAIGYAMSWASKWLIATLLTGTDVVREAAAAFGERAGLQTGGSRHLFGALRDNLLRLAPTVRHTAEGLTGVALPAVLIGVVALVWLLLFWRARGPSSQIRLAAHALLVAFLPYLWFAFARQHSAVHFWFTYRIQAITVFAVAYLALTCIDFRSLGDRLRLLPSESSSDRG